MNKSSAIEVKKATLEAVRHLLLALKAAEAGYDEEEYARVHRQIGLLVGEAQVGILDAIYEQYPDLSDLT